MARRKDEKNVEPADLSNLTGSYVASMRSKRPRKEGAATFDIVMSDLNILGDVKYVLLVGNEPFDRMVGGFPFGRISEVFGLENCGKTAMMIRAMCRFQANHIYEVISREGFIYTVKRVPPEKIVTIQCYVDNEHSLETGFKTTITDTSYDSEGKEIRETVTMKTALMVADTIDHIFSGIERFIDKIREAEEIIKEDGSERIVFGVFITDTIAGTSCREELERPWGDRDYPRQAAQISEGFRCLTNDISRHNVAAIFTNQVRGKFKDYAVPGHRGRINTPQEDDFSTFGGKALSFYSTHRVFMFKSPAKYTLVSGAQFPAGYLIGFRTAKNRLRKPGREARMVLLFDEKEGGLHNELSILESMLFLRVAERGEDGSISFKFRKNHIETTTFAQNVVLDDKSDAIRRRKPRDPSIDGRWQWRSFYRAHRSDLDLLWEAAMRHAYETEGLDEFYEPEVEGDDGIDGEDQDTDTSTPPPRRRMRAQALPGVAPEDA
jgi:RecA/RadA recombinase